MPTTIPVMSATDAALRSAVAQANTDAAAGTSDTIQFQGLNGDTITLSSQLELSGAGAGTITLDGGGQITLSGGSSVRLFQVDSGVTAVIENLTLTGGSAADDGGAVSNAGNLSLTGDTLSQSSVSGSNGGGAVYSTGTLTVSNSTLSGNTVLYGSGGGIWTSGSATVTGSNFTNNYAGANHGGGGGIYNTNGSLTLSGSTLSQNTAYFCYGGAVANTGGGTATLTNDTISQNNAENGGGGVFNFSSTMTVNGGTSITDNSSDEGAGAGIFNFGGTLAIDNAAISGNSQAGYDYYFGVNGGGGIFNTASLTISNATLSGNSTEADGGAIWNSGNLTFSGTLSDNNARSGLGGGIATEGTATVSNANLSGNTANYGGGIFNNQGATLSVTTTTFSANAGGKAGGGLYSSGALSLSTSTFAGNTAQYGGGFYNDNQTLTLSNSTFTSNTAYLYGGAINNQGDLTLENATVSGNTVTNNGSNAVTYGGGIANGATLTLLNSIVAGNSASASEVGFDPDIDGALAAGSSFNLIGDGTGMTGISNGDANGNQVGTKKNPINPLLGPLADNGGPTQTMALLPGSPAIGTGGAVNGISTDQRDDPLASPIDIGAFQYFLPLITSVSPALGAAAGGTSVTIMGYNLSNAQVNFGGNAAAQITSDTATQIVAVSPQGAVGTVHVTVMTANGNSVNGAIDEFSYESTPVITSVTPAVGPTAGGTNVQITGTSLGGATAVYFGAAVPANAATIVSDTTTQLVVTAPAQQAGQAEITVVTPFGTSVLSPPTDDYGFAPPGSIKVTSALDPATPTPGTLRYAINQANTDAPKGISDTITFDTTQMGTDTITLSQGPLELMAGSGVFTINGAGEITISGNSAQSLFQVDTGAEGILQGLTLTGGSAAVSGGAIVNAGSLTLSADLLSNNSAVGNGGAVENSGSLTIDSTTISGNSAGLGGAIDSSSTLLLNGAMLSGNSAANGGGIYASAGTVALDNSTLSGNSADQNGGGIFSDAMLTVNGSTISGNTAFNYGTNQEGGGGIFNDAGTTVLDQATISGNSAFYPGGGVYNGGTLTATSSVISDNKGVGLCNAGTMTVSLSTVSGNSNGYGSYAGGIDNSSGSVTLNASTIADNDGGIEDSGSLTVNSCTISANNGAGILNMVSTYAAIALQNSVVAGNTFTDLENGFNGPGPTNSIDPASAYNLIGSNSGVSLNGNHNQVGVSAPFGLAPLGDYGGPTPTVALLAGSPAIAAGELLPGITTDQRGLPLPSTPDIGAFQTQASTFLTLPSALPGGGSAVAGVSFSAALTAGGASGSNTFTVAAGHLPGGMTFSKAGVFAGTPTVAGSYTFTVLADNNVNTGMIGVQTYTFTVAPAAIASFVLAAPSLATTGFSFGITLTAKDDFGNVVTNYAGTPSIASSGGQNVHATPKAIKFNKGIANVSLMLNNAGAVTLTATAGTIKGTANMDVRTPATLTVTNAADQATLAPGTLRAAFDQATADALLNLSDTIAFDTAAMGTGTITLLQGLLELTGGPGTVTINGQGKITLSGGGVNGVFQIDGGAKANISGVTVTHGQGGGIYNQGTLTLSDATLRDNNLSNGEGGGIDNTGGGTLTLNNVTFSNNTAGFEGGGLYNNYESVLIANNLTFTNNASPSYSGSGGAFYNDGTATISNAAFYQSYAGDEGGAIYNDATLTLANATLGGNSASFEGGGIYNSGSLQLTNVTLSGNTSSGDGGGIYQGGALTAGDTTLSGNSAAGNGGGILQSGGSVDLQASIVAGNLAASSGPDISGAVAAGSAHNLIGDGTGLTGISNGTNGNQIGTSAHPTNALLAPLGNYGGPYQTMALLPHSPAIAAGAALKGVTTDERGLTRPATPDIGAYQTQVGTFLSLSPGNLAAGKAGTAYSTTITAGGGAGNYSYAIAAGALPAGMTLGSGGALAGTPTVAGTYHFTVLATDSAGHAGIRSYTLTINAGDFAGFDVFAPTTASPGVGFSVTIMAVDGKGNLIAGNTDTVMLMSSDNQTVNVSPATITLVGGTATVTVTLNTPGTVTLTASSGGMQGVSNNIAVSTQLVVSTASDLPEHSGTSLRDALATANAAAAAGISDAITFNAAQLGSNTITLDQGALELTTGTGTITIDGGGVIAISGGLATNLFTIDSGAAAIFAGLTIEDSSDADSGGGIANAGTLTLTRCTVANNSAARYRAGGAIVNSQAATMTATNSTFMDNAAYSGGAISNLGTLTVSNSTFWNNNAQSNIASGVGGAIDNAGTLTISDSTFSGNSGQSGGAIYTSGGSLTLLNTIVAGNTASSTGTDIDGQVTAASAYNLIGDGTGLTGVINGTNNNQIGTGAVPLLANLSSAPGNNGGPTQTLALQSGSPGIGTGGPITTIAQAAGTADQTIYVNDAAAIASTPGQYFILVDGEEMEVTNVNLGNNSLTVTRAINGVSAAPKQNDPVLLFTDQRGFQVTGSSTDIGAFQTQATGAAAFTSAGGTSFVVGVNNSFALAASGFPLPSFTESNGDNPPQGVTFDAATGTLKGMPTATGTYTLHFTAQNNGGTATQTFTLNVVQQPQFTSGTSATFTLGSSGTFPVTATGLPAPSLSEDPSDTLPAGVTFNAYTGTLSGIPLPGTGGTYLLHFRATNGYGKDATQIFTLTVNAAPAFTSPASYIFAANAPGTFTVTASGSPAPTISESATDKLPGTVTFVNGVLSGTATTPGSYTLHFTAHNGQGADATQTFTLIIGQAAAFTSAGSTTFTVGKKGTFTIKASGSPAPTLSESLSDTLPPGVTFNPRTGVLSGAPATGSGGSYSLHFIAHSGAGADVTQTFTLTVNQPLAFTSASHYTFVEDATGSFQVSAAGFPVPALNGPAQIETKTGKLVATFDPATGVLAETPALGTSGTYTIVFTASDGGVMKPVKQTFTLTVTPLTLTLSAPSGVTEGVAQSKVLVGKFTDADNTAGTTYNIRVNWGDGQVSSTVAKTVTVEADSTPGVFDIMATKPTAYAEAGAALKFSISIAAHNFTAAESTMISVADAQIALNTPLPTLAPVVGHALTSIEVATFTDQNLLSKSSDFTATINWGDGTSSTGVVAAEAGHKGVFIIRATKPKPYKSAATGLTFTVTVKDRGGAMDSQQATINVSAK